jgi:hypothetical protein
MIKMGTWDRQALGACLLTGMGLEGWGLWVGRDKVTIQGVMAVDVGCCEFMIGYDGVWYMVGLEFWLCLEGMVSVWFGCLVLILMIVGLDLLIKCMIPLELPLLRFVYHPVNKIPYRTNE